MRLRLCYVWSSENILRMGQKPQHTQEKHLEFENENKKSAFRFKNDRERVISFENRFDVFDRKTKCTIPFEMQFTIRSVSIRVLLSTRMPFEKNGFLYYKRNPINGNARPRLK